MTEGSGAEARQRLLGQVDAPSAAFINVRRPRRRVTAQRSRKCGGLFHIPQAADSISGPVRCARTQGHTDDRDHRGHHLARDQGARGLSPCKEVAEPGYAAPSHGFGPVISQRVPSRPRRRALGTTVHPSVASGVAGRCMAGSSIRQKLAECGLRRAPAPLPLPMRVRRARDRGGSSFVQLRRLVGYAGVPAFRPRQVARSAGSGSRRGWKGGAWSGDPNRLFCIHPTMKLCPDELPLLILPVRLRSAASRRQVARNSGGWGSLTVGSRPSRLPHRK